MTTGQGMALVVDCVQGVVSISSWRGAPGCQGLSPLPPKLLVNSFSSGRAYKQGVTRLLWLWLLDLQVKADGQERGLSLYQAVTPELFPRYHHSERTVSHLAECQQFASSNKVLMATGQDSVDRI